MAKATKATRAIKREPAPTFQPGIIGCGDMPLIVSDGTHVWRIDPMSGEAKKIVFQTK